MFDDNIRDDYRDILTDEARMAHSIAENSIKALCAAIKHHCRGEMVPEEVACFCREEAVNLDRDLSRSRGQTPGPMPAADILEDYYDCQRPTSTPAS